MNFHRLVLIAAIAVLVMALDSCATSRMLVQGKFDDPASQGLVVFYTGSQENGDEVELSVDISLLIDGQEVGHYRNYDPWSSIGDFRIACAPGRYDFLISHQNFRDRISVTVEAGRLSFVSLRKQFLSETRYGTYGTGITTTTVYLISSAIARETLPLEWDSTSIEQALGSSNWGVRHYALRSLRQYKGALSAQSLALVADLARSDPVEGVRFYAKAVLAERKQTIPRPPLFLEGFEDNLHGYWPILEQAQSGVTTWFGDSGYTIRVEPEEQRWITPSFPWLSVPRDKQVFWVDCAQVEGEDGALYGLCLAESDKYALFFGISRHGGASVWSFRDGIWSALLPWTDLAAASIREQTYSRLLVSKSGNSYEFKVNDQIIGTVTAELFPHRLGMTVKGPQTVNFYRLLAD